MARPTPYQRAWVHVIEPADCPFDTFDSYWTHLQGMGFDGIILGNVHIGTDTRWTDTHTRFLAEGRRRGFLFTMMGWLNGDDPADQARFAAELINKYKINRYMANAEDPFQATEYSDGGRSKIFLDTLDPLIPYSISVNTYPGVDLDWREWQAHGARCYIQTYNEGNLRLWPADVAVQWAVDQGFSRTRIKPVVPSYKTSAGERADSHVLIEDMKRARTCGFSVYAFERSLDVFPDWYSPFRSVIGPEGIAREG